jgi:hypothetical protein
VEYFDPSPAAQEKKYAFKCHRQTIDDVDHVWPVNALAFHPMYAPVFLRRWRRWVHAHSVVFTIM